MPWYGWTAIGAAVIIALIIAMVFIVRSGKNDKEVEEVEVKEEASSASQETKEEPVSEVEPRKEQPAPEEEEEEEEEESQDVEVETPTEDKEKKTVKAYHISKRKSDGMWQIKLAGGKKAIKLFRTQQEAIDYCKVLAENQDAKVTVHKKDGSFRKQNY